VRGGSEASSGEAELAAVAAGAVPDGVALGWPVGSTAVAVAGGPCDFASADGDDDADAKRDPPRPISFSLSWDHLVMPHATAQAGGDCVAELAGGGGGGGGGGATGGRGCWGDAGHEVVGGPTREAAASAAAATSGGSSRGSKSEAEGGRGEAVTSSHGEPTLRARARGLRSGDGACGTGEDAVLRSSEAGVEATEISRDAEAGDAGAAGAGAAPVVVVVAGGA